MCKLEDITKQYPDLNPYALKAFLVSSGCVEYAEPSPGDIWVRDESAEQLVLNYRHHRGEPMLTSGDFQALRRRAKIDRLAKSLPVTSSPSLEGYRIVRYGGYVSGDGVVSVDDKQIMSSGPSNPYRTRIKETRVGAINNMKHACAKMKCNAVIGLHFDHLVLNQRSGNSSLTDILITANGTAVQVEPKNVPATWFKSANSMAAQNAQDDGQTAQGATPNTAPAQGATPSAPPARNAIADSHKALAALVDDMADQVDIDID